MKVANPSRIAGALHEGCIREALCNNNQNFFRIPMQCAFVKNLHSDRKNGKKHREYTDYIVLLFPLG